MTQAYALIKLTVSNTHDNMLESPLGQHNDLIKAARGQSIFAHYRSFNLAIS